MIQLTTLLAESKLKLNIPSDIKKIYKLFKKNGKQLFVVGGAVRDAILGKSPKDFDLATDAKPNEVIQIAKDNGLSTTDEVGKAYGVVIVNGHEIATFRKDIGKDKRKRISPKVMGLAQDVVTEHKLREMIREIINDISKDTSSRS